VISLILNKKNVSAEPGDTILDLSRKHGIEIPTMCHLDGLKAFTSCMVCVVQDEKQNRLIPACSTRVSDGMIINTENDTVRKARKDTLDLLLSEHVGNCEAPCLRACPAYMNIPLMIKQIKDRQFEAAIKTVKRTIALPAVLGRICPAPCERGCNRKYYDETLSICLLKRFVADVDLASGSPYQPKCKSDSGKKVAIIGAGPAGLSAAYYLAQKGHQSNIFDQNNEPGGLLRYGVPDDKYDKNVLDAEIEQIRNLNKINFNMNQTMGSDFSLNELQNEFDAVIIATGTLPEKSNEFTGITTSKRGITVNPKTFQTNLKSVFAGGNVVAEGRMAIRSLAHGRFIAESVDQVFSQKTVDGFIRRFNSVVGRLETDEARELLQLVNDIEQLNPADVEVQGFTQKDAMEESTRCFRCDCRKPESCKLRIYSQEYGVDQKRFKTGPRKPLKLLTEHPKILFEPGKCIKCGLCVQITEKYDDIAGLTFAHRGYEAVVKVPFGDSLDEALKVAFEECVMGCPTGALAFREHLEDNPDE
jgi:ferredoxin